MKTHSVHVCRECGTTSPRWAGRCPGCGEWNSLDEQRAPQARRAPAHVTASLADVTAETGALLSTGVGEFDRVLGGGLGAGSTTLLFGEPGVGKSTLALMALRFVAAHRTVLLIAAEESPHQVAQRARRLGDVPRGLEVAATTDVVAAEGLLSERRPALCVVDSISAMSDESLASVTGSVPQIRHAAERLCAAAKANDTALVLVGHVTKDGELAGPRALEHLVDTVVRIEGDRHGTLRFLRTLKHRFGPTGEVGLLEMAHEGLRELPDAALAFRGPQLGVPGVVFGVTNDGSRSLLVEMQALVTVASSSPRRVAHQVSSQRLSLLLAVLEARCAIDTSGCDVFAATAGGLPASEPGVDVALALAVASATKGFSVSSSLAAMGEVGLAGELRSVAGLSRRVREAQRLGATEVIVPACGELDEVTGLLVHRCRSLAQAIDVARHGAKSESG